MNKNCSTKNQRHHFLIKINNTTVATLAATIITFGSLAGGANAAVLLLDPGLPLQASDGPFGFRGRGVVFTAQEDFSMSSFGMELGFTGSLNFSVNVYAVTGTSRGDLLSQTTYSNLSDDASSFFTLNHNHTFTTGSTYEILLTYDSPGVAFTHYDFDNVSLNPGQGFAVRSEMLVLDGSDSNSSFVNSWLGNFQINTSAVPEPSSTLLIWLGALGLVVRRKRTA